MLRVGQASAPRERHAAKVGEHARQHALVDEVAPSLERVWKCLNCDSCQERFAEASLACARREPPKFDFVLKLRLDFDFCGWILDFVP